MTIGEYQVTNGWGTIKVSQLLNRVSQMVKADWFSEKVYLQGGSPANEAEIDPKLVEEKKKKGFTLFNEKNKNEKFAI